MAQFLCYTVCIGNEIDNIFIGACLEWNGVIGLAWSWIHTFRCTWSINKCWLYKNPLSTWLVWFTQEYYWQLQLRADWNSKCVDENEGMEIWGRWWIMKHDVISMSSGFPKNLFKASSIFQIKPFSTL